MSVTYLSSQEPWFTGVYPNFMLYRIGQLASITGSLALVFGCVHRTRTLGPESLPSPPLHALVLNHHPPTLSTLSAVDSA